MNRLSHEPPRADMKHLLTIILALSTLLAACGSDGPPPHILQINSQDVVQTAVSRIEIVFTPGDVNQTFQMTPDMAFFGGSALSRVTGGGEFVITLEQEYVTAHAFQDAGVGAFIIEVPLSPSGAADPGSDPTLAVTFIRGTERIAEGARFLAFPLAEGGRSIVPVLCKRDPVNFGPQCTNNDPPPGSTSGGDAGM